MVQRDRIRVLFIACSLLAACETRNVTEVAAPPAANSQNSNANAAVATDPKPLPPSAASLPVTMPLLDAMFTDEHFIAEVRQSMQVSDEEFAKIRDAAKNEVLQLGTVDEDDLTRSTRSSVEKTRSEVEKILGPQRTEQFFNLVRLRWAGTGDNLAVASPNSVPSDTRIVVNTPAFRMDLFKDGSLIKSYKIGIGYPEFPLPAGLRRATEIIFNPTWTPTDEPWVKGKVSPGQKVEAGRKLNALGPIKIPIGLPSLIHGGKAPARLGNFASHGCVGLTNDLVQDLAVRLGEISGTPLNIEKVKGYAKNPSETETVKLQQPVPVELRYETIVVEDGKVTVYRDVYEKGTNTEESLRRTLEAHGVNLDQLSEPERSTLLQAIREMSIPADGKPDTAANSNSNRNSNSGKVTRNVKGKKEIVVPVAALAGKGYPTAVDVTNK